MPACNSAPISHVAFVVAWHGCSEHVILTAFVCGRLSALQRFAESQRHRHQSEEVLLRYTYVPMSASYPLRPTGPVIFRRSGCFWCR